MKTKILVILSLTAFLLLFTACDGKSLGTFDDHLTNVNQAQVWIDQPLDGTTILSDSITVTAHGYAEFGMGGFQVELVGVYGPQYVIKQGSVLTFGYMVYYMNGVPSGWQTIRVILLNTEGEEMASTEVDVYVDVVDIEDLINQTLEAATQNAPPVPTATPTPEPVDRCQLFDPSTTTLTLLDVPMFTTDLTYYLTFDHPVYGFEQQVEGDDGEWIYTAVMGNQPEVICTYRDYASRIYCYNEEFPSGWWGSAQPLEVYVNGCDQPIFTHLRVSILKPACEATMGEEACEWTGGDYECVRTICECTCP